MGTEYRLVATRLDGRQKRWPERSLRRAQKALADLQRDLTERPHPQYTDPRIEQREVGEWRIVNF